ncbi:MAG: AraC-like DNA-binding protein [Lentisphaeria bacterium]|jgi:AraC-like DNA-binding protein
MVISVALPENTGSSSDSLVNSLQTKVLVPNAGSYFQDEVERAERMGLVTRLRRTPLHTTEDFLRSFYQIVVNSHVFESHNEAINLLLDIGRVKFKAQHTLVLRQVSEAVYEVQASTSGDQRFYVGQHISTARALCHKVLVSDEPCVQLNIDRFSLDIPLEAYNGLDVRAYIGVQAKTYASGRSVLCFISTVGAQTTFFGEEDQQILERLSEGVAFLLDQQKNASQRKVADSSMFASGSANTLEEYLSHAKLPELYGIPGRVVETLEKRVGESPLSIGHIAESLNLSKRTLQRRLQQQSLNFAELRDQVRYHFAIEYLIKNRRSIDSISIALDFSDRTSFTNAFKRWTGLSPSIFRKLFRDFV